MRPGNAAAGVQGSAVGVRALEVLCPKRGAPAARACVGVRLSYIAACSELLAALPGLKDTCAA